MPATLSSTYGRLGAVLVQYRLFRQIYQRPVGEHLNSTFVSFDWSNDTPYSDVQASAATTCGYHRSLRLFVAYNNKFGSSTGSSVLCNISRRCSVGRPDCPGCRLSRSITLSSNFGTRMPFTPTVSGLTKDLCIVKTAPPTKSRTYAPLEFRAEDGETPPLCSRSW